MVEIDEQTGFQEKVISESRNKKLIPTLLIEDNKGKCSPFLQFTGWRAPHDQGR
jgi:hypothetical protein